MAPYGVHGSHMNTKKEVQVSPATQLQLSSALPVAFQALLVQTQRSVSESRSENIRLA